MKKLQDIGERLRISFAGFGAVIMSILAFVLVLYILTVIIRLFYIGVA